MNATPTEQREMHILATYLDLRKLFWLHIPNEGKRSPRQGALLKRIGLRPGASDVIVMQRTPDGRNGVMIELKRKRGGRLSVEQEAFLVEAARHGWATYVARGAHDAIRYLQGLGW